MTINRHVLQGSNLSEHPNKRVARLVGFEPTTYGLEGRCSIQMSYRRITQNSALTYREKTPFIMRLLSLAKFSLRSFQMHIKVEASKTDR